MEGPVLKKRLGLATKRQIADNHSWSLDFMSFTIMGLRKFRTFNVMNNCTREALAIDIDTSLSSKRIIRTLESVIAWRGKPTVNRNDNGPEFSFKEFEW